MHFVMAKKGKMFWKHSISVEWGSPKKQGRTVGRTGRGAHKAHLMEGSCKAGVDILPRAQNKSLSLKNKTLVQVWLPEGTG